MIEKLVIKLKEDKEYWNEIKQYFVEKKIPAHKLLLEEGQIADTLFFIKKGCLRMWFNNDGKDITFQFFFEGQAVASIESFINGKPGMFTIESIEPTDLISIKKEHFDYLLNHNPEMKEGFQQILYSRFRNYAQLFLSRIKDNPRKRYEDLLENHPEIIKRVPQHYIASYLGITPVSLSRIRNKK